MSVTSTVQLPQQPTTGSTIWVPLGGNGYTSPHSMFEVDVQLANDASGGDCRLFILTDPRWESIINRAELIVASQAAQAEFTFNLNISQIAGFPPKVPMNYQGEMDLSSLTGTGACSWDLPPHIDAQQISATLDNVDDTETSIIRAWIFNFHKDASQRVPLNVLLGSIPRAGSGSSVQAA